MRSVSLFCDAEVIDAADLADYVPLAPAPASLPPARASYELPSPPAAGAASDLSDIYARAQASGMSLRELKREIERQCIVRALADAGGNITRAAEILRMKRPRLSQLLKEHGLSGTVATRSSASEVE